MTDCVHEKVYSPDMTLDIPPTQDWICRICLETGTDTIEDRRLHDFYDLHQQKLDAE